MKVLAAGAFALNSIFPISGAAQSSVVIEPVQETAKPMPRLISPITSDPFSLTMTYLNTQEISGRFGLSSPGSESFAMLDDRLGPEPLHIGPPLIQTKGIVKGDGFLFISDTGKDSTHDEPAKIWRFNPETRELKKFYKGPLLVNSQWLYYRPATESESALLVISDYGYESVPRAPGTGVGAKVFVIPVSDQGEPGEPRVLHEGRPLRSPEGVTMIGDTVILADWAAGSPTMRPEVPEAEFLSGAIFAIPLKGGEPRKLFDDQTWITVIGVCIYPEPDGLYLRVIDIDGGRHDTSSSAALPQSGVAAFYRAKVLDLDGPSFGPLMRTDLTEDTPLAFRASGLELGQRLRVVMGENTRLESDENVEELSSIGDLGLFSVVARTSMDEPKVQIKVEVIEGDGSIVDYKEFVFEKDPEGCITCDNKHAGSQPCASCAEEGLPWLSATADGTSRSLVLFSPDGGTPGMLWQGEPFVSPMGVQFSPDQTRIWMTDQSAGPNGTAAIFEVSVPPAEQLKQMFPNVAVPE